VVIGMMNRSKRERLRGRELKGRTVDGGRGIYD
jgi:hypothetical protein